MKTSPIILITALLLNSINANATIRPCVSDLGTDFNRSAMGDLLPITHHLELPLDFVAMFKSHPIFRRLREQYGDRSNYVFNIQHYSENHKAGFLDSVYMRTFGETVQSQFIVRCLKILFPNAEFVEGSNYSYSKWRDEHPEKQLVTIWINDKAERVNLELDGLPGLAAFQMPTLKRINPGFTAIPHKSYRSRFGIPQDMFIASLYMHPNSGRVGDVDEFPSPTATIREIEKVKDPQIVILSHTGSTKFEHLKEIVDEVPDRQVLPLSQLGKIIIEPGTKYLFYNDLRGLMPIVYNISDFAVVSGPVNFFEPLTSGAPVLFFETSAAIGRYHKTTFETMASDAKSSGGGFGLKSLSELSLQLEKILLTPPKITPPYAIPANGAGSSLMEDFMLHVEDVIQWAFRLSDRQKEEYDRINKFGYKPIPRPPDWTPY